MTWTTMVEAGTRKMEIVLSYKLFLRFKISRNNLKATCLQHERESQETCLHEQQERDAHK